MLYLRGMQLSVVILNYNVRYFLEQCLDSVQKALDGIDGEIIVVDNASPDDSCTMVRQKFPDVKLIAHPVNAGFPKGNNLGVELAKGRYLCILNPDTVVAEDTFRKVLAFADAQPNLGIVGCRLIDGTGHFLPESKRGVPTPWVAFTKVAGLYKVSGLFGKYYAKHLSDGQTGKVDILVGAFMLMETDTYRTAGGFDENCFMYSDDIDLSYTVLKSGKNNFYFHATSVIHYKGESTLRDGLYMQRFRQAMDFFYRKHFRSSWLFDQALRMGAFAFSHLKKSQAVTVEKVPSGYVLLSPDAALADTLSRVLGKPVFRANPIDLARIAESGSEVLIDVEAIGYAHAIELMEQYRDEKLTFKNVLASRGFMIGSNSRDDRGKVVVWDTRR